jgi:hypothetical protein
MSHLRCWLDSPHHTASVPPQVDPGCHVVLAVLRGALASCVSECMCICYCVVAVWYRCDGSTCQVECGGGAASRLCAAPSSKARRRLAQCVDDSYEPFLQHWLLMFRSSPASFMCSWPCLAAAACLRPCLWGGSVFIPPP